MRTGDLQLSTYYRNSNILQCQPFLSYAIRRRLEDAYSTQSPPSPRTTLFLRSLCMLYQLITPGLCLGGRPMPGSTNFLLGNGDHVQGNRDAIVHRYSYIIQKEIQCHKQRPTPLIGIQYRVTVAWDRETRSLNLARTCSVVIPTL